MTAPATVLLAKEVAGKGITGDESGSKCERQTFHDEVELPDDLSVRLALLMPTVIDNGSMHTGPSITIGPSFAQHDDERGEERSSLDVDGGGIRVSPLRESTALSLVWAFPNEVLSTIVRNWKPIRS